MTNNLTILKTPVVQPKLANSGDVVKMTISLVGTGELDNPSTSVSIKCRFWVKVLDKPPDKNWLYRGGGWLVPIGNVTYKREDALFTKKGKTINVRNSEQVINMINEAISRVRIDQPPKRSGN